MRRARAIGQDTFIKAEELEKGETVFECATYLGQDEGQFGEFSRFDVDGTVYCIGGASMAMAAKSLVEGDKVEVEFEGWKQSKNFKGKKFAAYKLWLLEDDSEPDTEEEATEPVPSKPKSKGRGRPKGSTKKATAKTKQVEETDDLDDLDDLE